ncbi:MAG: DUF805 domain-containing protein [Chloroflexi bacterium]|nr:DUF805 domain-containing protein [Chloroflexota bacterium]
MPTDQPSELSVFFSFSGRINRVTFWAGQITLLAVYFLGAIASETIYVATEDTDAQYVVALMYLIGFALLLYCKFAILAKRWHDHDKSGWWSLIGLVPVIGAIWIFIELGCFVGDEDWNRFGPPPNGRTVGPPPDRKAKQTRSPFLEDM